MADVDEELARARRVYTARAADPSIAAQYEPFLPINVFTVQERDWIVASLLRATGLTSLAGLDILDVGCGSGGELRRMTTFGADQRRLAGIDLMEARILAAQATLPQARLTVGSAHRLPFPDASFDLVSQFTLFSSVAHPGVRREIAREMRRVLRPRGRILWYDIRSMTPTPDLVPITLDEIRALFPGFSIAVRPATLRWRLGHAVVPRSRMLGQLLERVPPLCSHYVAVMRREAEVAPLSD